MTSEVIWIRHGTSRDGHLRPDAHPHADSPLTEQGVREIRNTAAALAAQGVQAKLVLSSPLPRAVQSARVLAREWRLPVAPPVSEFAEWRAPDCVIGHTPRDYPDDYRRWRSLRDNDPDSALPGGESLSALLNRAGLARARAHEIAEQHAVIAVVTHRVLLGCIDALNRGITLPAEAFAAAREFQLRPGGWWIEPWGDVSPEHHD